MEVEADIGTEQMAEASSDALFGPLDIILLIALLGVGIWWLMKSRSKQDTISSNGKSYSIQSVLLN